MSFFLLDMCHPSWNVKNKGTQTCPCKPLYYWVCQIIDIYSIRGQSRASELIVTQGVVWISDGFWRKKTQRLKMCFSRYNQCPSPHAITLKHLTSLPSTQLFATLGEYIFQPESHHSYGYQLCSYSRRLLLLFVWGKLHTGASQEARKEARPILLFHSLLYRWCPFTI